MALGVALGGGPSAPEPGDEDEISPLVRAAGVEAGARTEVLPGVESALSAWYLQSGSEVLFAGPEEAGELGRDSERYGLRWTGAWAARDWLELDLELALARARYREPVDGGRVPGAVESSLGLGATLHQGEERFLSLSGRLLGPRDLTGDGSERSGASLLVDLQGALRLDGGWVLRAGLFNLLDQDVSDVEEFDPFFAEGGFAGVGGGAFDELLASPTDPFSVRVGLSGAF